MGSCFLLACTLASMPGDDLLFHRLSDSTIGAVWFHGRVRDGIGWVTDAMATKLRNSRGVCWVKSMWITVLLLPVTEISGLASEPLGSARPTGRPDRTVGAGGEPSGRMTAPAFEANRNDPDIGGVELSSANRAIRTG